MQELEFVEIKDFVPISDTSFYIFLALCLFAVAIFFYLGVKIFDYFKHKPKSKLFEARQSLLHVEFGDAKKAAYVISKNAFILAQSDLQCEFLEELNEALEKYKYKKNVPEFSPEDKEKLKIFMDLCDV